MATGWKAVRDNYGSCFRELTDSRCGDNEPSWSHPVPDDTLNALALTYTVGSPVTDPTGHGLYVLNRRGRRLRGSKGRTPRPLPGALRVSTLTVSSEV